MSCEQVPKRLSYLLRRSKEPRSIASNGGRASVDEMLRALCLTREQSDGIVATDRKGRYSYDDTGMRIRARAFAAAGHALCRFANGVWQVRAVPTEHLEALNSTDREEAAS